MSARERLQATVTAGLKAALAPVTVFDMPPERAGLPYVVVEEPVLARRDLAAVTGFEGRVTVSAYDDGERPARVRRLAGLIEDTAASLPPDLGDGWRLTQRRLVRSRIVRGRDGRWAAASEFAVNIYRENG